MKCKIARTEGGLFEDVDLPRNIRKKLPALSGLKPVASDKHRYVDLRDYGFGFVAAVLFKNKDIYDPELLKHGIDPWSKFPWDLKW